MFTQSIINQFHFRIRGAIFKQKVLRLNVSVHNSNFVKMFNCTKNLWNYWSSVSFTESFLLNNSVEEFSTWTVLSYKMIVFWILIWLKKLNAIGMIDLSKNVYLLLNHHNIIIFNLASWHWFNGIPWFWIWDFWSKSHNSKLPMPNNSPYFVNLSDVFLDNDGINS